MFLHDTAFTPTLPSPIKGEGSAAGARYSASGCFDGWAVAKAGIAIAFS
jgi:hypothetical protein